MGRTYLVGEGELLGVVVLAGPRNNDVHLRGERGDDGGGARGRGGQVHVHASRLLDVESGQGAVGLHVNLVAIDDVDAGYDIVENDVGLLASLCAYSKTQRHMSKDCVRETKNGRQYCVGMEMRNRKQLHPKMDPAKSLGRLTEAVSEIASARVSSIPRNGRSFGARLPLATYRW